MILGLEAYIQDNKEKPFEVLIEERNRVYQEIRDYEEGRYMQGECRISESPDILYENNLQYIIEICKLIDEAYHSDSLE